MKITKQPPQNYLSGSSLRCGVFQIALRRLFGAALINVAVAIMVLMPTAVGAAGLAPRSVQVGSSGQGVVTSYTINATTATTDDIGSVKFEFCTAATGACALPGGVVTTGATLTAQSPAGFSMVNGSNGAPYITRTAANINAGVAMSFTLGDITNPNSPNLSYYVRITTYNGTDGSTGPVDTGTVAMSTAEPVQLTGVTPEILVFCVGTSIGGDCTSISGNTIDFGDFSPTATRAGTSVMQAQTNAANGYAITVNGTTLASGANTIPAMGTQTLNSGGCAVSCTPSVGSSQFGLNLRQDNVAGIGLVGADPTGVGTGTYYGGYGTQNQYRFFSGDTVATAGIPTNANTFTSTYVVNIGGAQAAGVYTATMTYICTAAF